MFIRSLETMTKAKIGRVIDLLEDYGQTLGMPHSKAVATGIFELRIHGKQEIRILYTFHKGDAVLLKAFVKKTEKLPRRELKIAIERKKMLDKE